MPLPLFSEKPVKVKNLIAIAAGKGGVGKSSVTVNLALALQQKGFFVGVMDMDIYGPSIRKMLPEDSLPVQKGELILPALSRGIKVISFAYFRNEAEANAVRAPIANGIVTQFMERIDWGHLDYLLIDFPPGTGDVQLTICQKANLTGAIIVTTPQDLSLIDVRKAMNLFEQVNVPVVGIVENMSFFLQNGEKIYIFGKGGGERLAREKGVPLLGQVPIDPLICRCGDSGESLFVKETPVAQVYHHIADEVLGQLEVLKGEQQGCLDHFELEWREMDESEKHPANR
jgi:ATP-binding protein involved in chromosome partitioning